MRKPKQFGIRATRKARVKRNQPTGSDEISAVSEHHLSSRGGTLLEVAPQILCRVVPTDASASREESALQSHAQTIDVWAMSEMVA